MERNAGRTLRGAEQLPDERTTPRAEPFLVSLARAVSGADFAAGDDGLLREGPSAVRVAVLAERCLSYGVGVDRSAAFLHRASVEGIPAFARRTGGTGLLHEPGDLAWTVVVPRHDPRVGDDLTKAYGRLGHGVVQWLEGHRVAAAWVPAPGLVPDYCTLGARGWVLSASGRILGGAAQHVVGDRLLHHGTVSMTVDRTTLDRIFGLGPPSPSARLVGARELGLAGDGAEFAPELAAAIASALRGG